MSLRSRLVLTVTLVAFLALAVADLVTYTSLRTVLVDQVDSSLTSAQGPISELLGGPPGPGMRPGGPDGASGDADDHDGFGAFGGFGGPSGADSEGRPSGAEGFGRGRQFPGPGSPGAGGIPSGQQLCAESSEQGDAPGAFVEVRTAGGTVVDGDRCDAHLPGGSAYSPLLPERIAPLDGKKAAESALFDAAAAQRGGPSFRVLASAIPSGPLAGEQLVLALSLGSSDSTLGRLVDIELAVTGGALVAALAFGWWLVHIELAPLRRVKTTAGAIAAGDWSRRVPGERARTEVGEVALAINAMLAAIERAFAERDATEARLRASEDRLRRFVGDAAHELRTPIAAASAYAQLAGRARGHEEDLPRILSGIVAESGRMAQIVEDLLTLARLDEQRPLRLEPVELVDLATGAVETARTVGPAWPLRIQASDAVEVLADRMQLRQVLDNLLANVRAHTPEGTRAVVRIATEGSDALLEVADDGPGMTPEQAERVFERFYRADPSRSRSTGGSGLGLAIVSAIAEAHGGEVSVHSTPGAGTTFTVRIPMAHRASSTADGEPAAWPSAGAPPAKPDDGAPATQPAAEPERS